MDFRAVLYVIGILMVFVAAGMLPPMVADLITGNPDWKVFFMGILTSLFFGGALIISNYAKDFKMNTKQAFLLIFLSWVVISIQGALPFYFSALDMSFTDSFFESMSGITTTGATVMTGLNEAPPGILLWRATLQWFGGIGIILMAMSVLPFLKIGGMQIFQAELGEDNKILPRVATLAKSIGLLYIGLTILCMLGYRMAGMSGFDALAHALTTISTGGFSTYDESFSHYTGSFSKEMVAMLFMLLGGMPFILYLQFISGNRWAILRDSQVRGFLAILLVAITCLVAYMNGVRDMPFMQSLELVSFNVISILTGTGYANSDYAAWGPFVSSFFLFLMAIGGCAGSTSCGIKVFRFQVLFAVAITQFKSLLKPHGVFIPYYNGRPIPKDVPVSVMSFFYAYGIAFLMLTLALAFTGMDFTASVSGAMSAISNVGPGLGETIGPAGTYQTLADSSKWVLIIGMFLGRLELFTVLVMLFPQFWRS